LWYVLDRTAAIRAAESGSGHRMGLIATGSQGGSRDAVADFVWCLENRVDSAVHTDIFPDSHLPKNVREKAKEPSDWDADSIRSTWLWNLNYSTWRREP